MNFFIAIVGVALLASASTDAVEMEVPVRPSPNADNVWMLDQNYSGYAYSPLKSRLLALGGLGVDELDLSTRTVARTYPLPLPGYSIGIGRSGRFASVVHNSYITFIDIVDGTSVTEKFPYTVVPVNGLVVDLTAGHATCGWIHPTENNQYRFETVCVNPTTGNATKCSDHSDHGGEYGFTANILGTPDGSNMYGLTSTDYIVKYYVPPVPTPPIRAPRCPSYRYVIKPNLGGRYASTLAWFSYDGSRIFLGNGVTLSTSPDESKDLQVRGSLNGDLRQQDIYWVDQDTSFAGGNDVVALVRVFDWSMKLWNFTINSYTWPSLVEKSKMEIPAPATPAGVKVMTAKPVGTQVHYYGTAGTQLIAVVNYTLDKYNVYAPGVAFITL